MFNFHNRHYIFRQSNGEIRNFYCDLRQNLCCGTLTRNGAWSDAVILAKNVYQYFYAELDQDNVYHILFQDNNGNIDYIVMDGQSAKTLPVLNSKTPSVYNKQLYIAPLKKDIYLFYVLQHENSFMLAYQLVRGSKPGTPKIVDYVSGSNIACSVLYDSSMNIYAFYQSYDGKYLQLGYKKFNTVQRHWSDFTPLTKYTGNCELPHALIDTNGTIHLCYQRRAPKLFEMVYQQKTPDKNFWSDETILHSSIHPFENASILQAEDKITVYWIRDDVIYYNIAPLSGENWSKPARYGAQLGRRLQCVCYKDQIQRGSIGSDDESFGSGDISSLSPGIYPGTVSNGFRLAFINTDSMIGAPPFAQFPPAAVSSSTASGDDLKKLLLSTFKQMQDNISEIRTGWTETKNEMSRLMNAYSAMSKELSKYSIRINMLEGKLNQLNKPLRKTGIVKDNTGISKKFFDEPVVPVEQPTGNMPDGHDEKSSVSMPDGHTERSSLSMPDGHDHTTADQLSVETSAVPQAERSSGHIPSENSGVPAAKKATPDLDPEAMKMWEEWKEPREWTEGG